MRRRQPLTIGPLALVASMLATAAFSANAPRPRVFVPESKSWSVGGGFNLTNELGHGDISGGAKPQTAEIIKTLQERCPEVIVTKNEKRADYVLLLQHEGGKIFLRKDNKFVLFDANGDAIASGSTRSLGNAVKDACSAIRQDWR